MKHVMLAMPTYGMVLPEVLSSVLDSVMFASQNGVQWRGQASTDREAWCSARNRPVAALRDRDDLDGLMWLDSDMVIPQDAIARLVAHDLDFVSALYFQRGAPFAPVAYRWNGKSFNRAIDYEDNVVAPIGGFGFGCCYTSIKMLRVLPKDPFQFGDMSEDLAFCRLAIEAGFQPHLDTGLKCSHYVGPEWATEKRYKKWHSVLVRET